MWLLWNEKLHWEKVHGDWTNNSADYHPAESFSIQWQTISQIKVSSIDWKFNQPISQHFNQHTLLPGIPEINWFDQFRITVVTFILYPEFFLWNQLYSSGLPSGNPYIPNLCHPLQRCCWYHYAIWLLHTAYQCIFMHICKPDSCIPTFSGWVLVSDIHRPWSVSFSKKS